MRVLVKKCNFFRGKEKEARGGDIGSVARGNLIRRIIQTRGGKLFSDGGARSYVTFDGSVRLSTVRYVHSYRGGTGIGFI